MLRVFTVCMHRYSLHRVHGALRLLYELSAGVHPDFVCMDRIHGLYSSLLELDHARPFSMTYSHEQPCARIYQQIMQFTVCAHRYSLNRVHGGLSCDYPACLHPDLVGMHRDHPRFVVCSRLTAPFSLKLAATNNPAREHTHK